MKFLLADIEQGPNTAYIWDPRTKYVPKGHVLDTSRTLCMAWKWYGRQGKTHFVAEWTPRRDHLEEIWTALDEADAVITYNGKKFDVPAGAPNCFGDTSVYNGDSEKCIECPVEFRCSSVIDQLAPKKAAANDLPF